MRKAFTFFVLVVLHTHLRAGENPMLFTKNMGQWDSRIQYIADLNMGKLLLEKNQITFDVNDFDHHKHAHNPNASDIIKGHIFRIKFEGGNTEQLIPEEKETAYRNYYIGNNPNFWKSNVPLYRKNTFKNLYPGIDMEVRGNENGFTYEYIIHAGANPALIHQVYEGINEVKIRNGEIHYKTNIGDVTEKNIVAYQIIKGKKQIVKCVIRKRFANSIYYEFPNGYDISQTLIIDPTVAFGTYTGATADNWGYTATYGRDGSMYIGALVSGGLGLSYPTTAGAFQNVYRGGTGTGATGSGDGIAYACDMGITKYTSNGSALVYSTYLGGNNNETPHSLVEDAQGNLIIYGVAYSPDYPVSTNAYDNTYNGDADIVVTKFNTTGTALIGSTYVGGTGKDGINSYPDEFTFGNLKFNYGDQNRGEVNIDATNNIYVASCTESSDFPVSSGAYQNSKRGGQDGCAFKMSNDCSALLWSTYIGGTNDDACYALDVRANGELYVCGGTMSNNFPTTSGTWNTSYRGGAYDGFVSHISNNGTQLLHSSYIGTSGNDQVYFVKVDGNGYVYFTGQTSGSYPVISATYSNPNSGQFITKLTGALDSIAYSTVFGNGDGRPNISPTAFLVDTCKNVYVAGWGTNQANIFGFSTNMFNLPTTPDALKSSTDGHDFYAFVLAKNATGILYGSYFGGNGEQVGEHVDGGTNRFDSRGVIYEAICAGCSGNSMTPATPGVWSPTNQSSNCNLFGLKMEFNLGRTEVHVDAYPRATGCVPLTVQFNSQLYNVNNVLWDFRDGSTSTQLNPVHTFTDTGVYNVMLIGTDPNSCNITDTAYVDVWVRDDSLVANFLSDIIIDCESRTVNLSSENNSTTQYLWRFGDGTTATTSAVSHTYSQAGNYTIRLVLSDSTRCDLRDSFTTSIFVPPVIDVQISASDTQGCAPLNVSFSNNTNYPNGTYRWFFGDGDSSHLRTPNHTYLNQGTYSGVVYWDDTATCNKRDTAFFTVTVIDSFADASFVVNRQFFNCDSAHIAVQSYYIGADSARWFWGDGTSSVANPATHSYISPAFDTITHILYDAKQSCHPIDTQRIIVSLTPLNADVTIPDTIGCVPFTVDFTGSSPTLTTDYFWFFGGGDSASGENVQHTFSQVGTYVVLMVARDSNVCVGIDSNYATIVVIDDFVDAQFSMNILNDCDSDLHIQFNDESINPVDFFWQFGDGTTSTLQNPEHHYTTPGTYTVTLIVTDTSRCHPIDSISYSVRLKPNSVAQFDVMNVCTGSEVVFNNSSVQSNATFNWQFGDGTISSAENPAHTYTASGSYDVIMILTDTSSCNVNDTAQQTVIVYPQPIANFVLERDTYKFETPVYFMNQSINSDTYVWNFGDGGTSTDFSPVYEYSHSVDWHQVCLEAYLTGAPCNDTICDSLFIHFVPLVGVPNAFSPNGDGVNDVVRVEGKGIIALDFRIFNRWGQQVYQGTDQNEGWDGFFKSEKQEMEVYTYLAIATMVNRQIIELKGNITLLR